jgi:hypothetical protein
MLEYERATRRLIERLKLDDPDRQLIEGYLQSICEHNKSRAQNSKRGLNRTGRVTDEALAAELNTVGGTLDDDIRLRDLRPYWKYSGSDRRILPWREKYDSLTRGQRIGLTHILGNLAWDAKVQTLGQLRDAIYDKLPTGYRRVSRQSLAFAQAVFARPQPTEPGR